jgi:hypothetical protein
MVAGHDGIEEGPVAPVSHPLVLDPATPFHARPFAAEGGRRLIGLGERFPDGDGGYRDTAQETGKRFPAIDESHGWSRENAGVETKGRARQRTLARAR